MQGIGNGANTVKNIYIFKAAKFFTHYSLFGIAINFTFRIYREYRNSILVWLNFWRV